MSDDSHTIVPYRTFILAWIALLVLTVVTVVVSTIDLGALNVWGAVAIASVKSGVVVAWFMHMKYEHRLLKGLLMIALVTVAIFIGLTLVDTLYR